LRKHSESVLPGTSNDGAFYCPPSSAFCHGRPRRRPRSR
jgi:hypothetical protein